MKKTGIIAALLTFALLISLCSCGLKHSIVGTWKNQTDIAFGVSVETVYVFNSDGTGKTTGALGIETDFTYEIDGDKLSITTKTLGIVNTTEYTASVTGDKLYLTQNGNTTEYVRSK